LPIEQSNKFTVIAHSPISPRNFQRTSVELSIMDIFAAGGQVK